MRFRVGERIWHVLPIEYKILYKYVGFLETESCRKCLASLPEHDSTMEKFFFGKSAFVISELNKTLYEVSFAFLSRRIIVWVSRSQFHCLFKYNWSGNERSLLIYKQQSVAINSIVQTMWNCVMSFKQHIYFIWSFSF